MTGGQDFIEPGDKDNHRPDAIVGPSSYGEGVFTNIQDALDWLEAEYGEGLLGIKTGTYEVDERIDVPENVSIQGNGMTVSIISLMDNSDCDILYFAGNDATKSYIRDLGIDGNIDNQASGNGLVVKTNDFSVYGVHIKDIKEDGIVINQDNCDILSCRIDNAGANGIVVEPDGDYVINPKIFGCYIGTIASNAIRLQGDATYTVQKANCGNNNLGSQLSVYGFFVYNCNCVILSNNIIDSGTYACRVVDSSRVLVSGHNHVNQITGGFSTSGNTYSYYRDVIGASGTIQNGNL